MTSQLIAAAASAALLGAGFASAEGTRSFEALPMHQTTLAADGAGGNKCKIDVIRTGSAGTADITRAVAADGSCVCTVTTGAANANDAAESIVTNLLRGRSCDGAPAPGHSVAEAASAGGGSGVVLPILVATVGAAGLAVAVGNDSKG